MLYQNLLLERCTIFSYGMHTTSSLTPSSRPAIFSIVLSPFKQLPVKTPDISHPAAWGGEPHAVLYNRTRPTLWRHLFTSSHGESVARVRKGRSEMGRSRFEHHFSGNPHRWPCRTCCNLHLYPPYQDRQFPGCQHPCSVHATSLVHRHSSSYWRAIWRLYDLRA